MSVTIIIPFFNRRNFIKSKFDHFLKYKDNKQFEFIFVNDGSTQNFDFLYNLNNIKIIHLETNLGVQHARNTGLEAATKKNVIFFDSDDVIDLRELDKNLLQLNSHFGYCIPKIQDENGGVRNSYLSHIPKFTLSPVPTSFLIFNVQFLHKNDLTFDVNLVSSQDDDIYLRCRLLTKPKRYRFSWGNFYNHNGMRITTNRSRCIGREVLVKKHSYLSKRWVTSLETLIYFR